MLNDPASLRKDVLGVSAGNSKSVGNLHIVVQCSFTVQKGQGNGVARTKIHFNLSTLYEACTNYQCTKQFSVMHHRST